MKKILEYAGSYRKVTYSAIFVLLLGTIANVLPFWFLYQIIRPLVTNTTEGAGYYLLRVVLILVCEVLYALLYTKGLSLSHTSAFHTLKNIRSFYRRKWKISRWVLSVSMELEH